MAPDFADVPDDVDHVLHFGLARGLAPLDFDGHLQGDAETGGLLLAHCRWAQSFLHCSSTSVYLQSSGLVRERRRWPTITGAGTRPTASARSQRRR
jgi:hypothetical protein